MFILVPLILLTIFNFFLILAVKKSSKQRSQLTPTLSTSGGVTNDEVQQQQTSRNLEKNYKRSISLKTIRFRWSSTRQNLMQSDQSQEHKITRMLIAVVLLAIMCQLPTALLLIYSSFWKASFIYVTIVILSHSVTTLQV